MLKIVFTSEDNENSMFGIEETRSYPGSKTFQKEETLSSGLITKQ